MLASTTENKSALKKYINFLKYPILLAIALGGIIAYNGWHIMSVEPQLQYRQYKYYDSAERYLRENFGLSAQKVESLIKPSVGNYFFFQSGMMIEKVAPFEMTFLYENGFPVPQNQILWHPIDDRFSLELTQAEIYQKDKAMFLKMKGVLVFKPRPIIDLLKLEKLEEEGFTKTDGHLTKAIEYDLKLNPNEQ